MNDEDIFELIIVDNGNIPTTRVRLSQLCADYDRIRLLQGHGNIGFSKGCNYGAELASGNMAENRKARVAELLHLGQLSSVLQAYTNYPSSNLFT